MKRTKFSVTTTPVREILSSKFSEEEVEQMMGLIDVIGFDEEVGTIDDLLYAPYSNSLNIHTTIEKMEKDGIRGLLFYSIGEEKTELTLNFVGSLLEVCEKDRKGTESAVSLLLKDCLDYMEFEGYNY